MSYTEPGDVNDGDPDDTPVGLAQAVDATIDQAQAALANLEIGQAGDLLTAAAATSDALIESLGGVDADEPDEGGTTAWSAG